MTYTTARAAFISAFVHSVLIAFILTLKAGPPVSNSPTDAMHVQLLSLEQVLGAQRNSEPRKVEPLEETTPAGLEALKPAKIETAATAPTPAGKPKPDSILPAAFEESIELAPPNLVSEPLIAALSQAASPSRDTHPIPEPELNMLSNKFSVWTGSFSEKRPDRSIAWRHEGQDYKARLKQVPAEDDMVAGYVVVEVSTEQNGARFSTELRMKRLSFANFAQFVDRWNPHVQIHRDEIDGRFHSNSEINLSYTPEATPKFHGRVTTTSSTINAITEEPISEDQLFPGGLETGVRRIAMPRHTLPLSGSRTVDETQVHRLTDNTRITFYKDGTYGWLSLDADAPEQVREISGDGHYIIGAEDKELRLKGVVKGKVLVYSPDAIVIEGDLTYSQYPHIDADSDDYLGLVSELSVEIAEPEIVGPGDLVITASIYAKRRFAVRDYHVKEYGTLLIYGSVTAGSVSATEPRFATKVEFDERLEDMRPPGFPLTDRYELEDWDGEWTKQEDITAETTSM